jgi:hypothetical protein
MLFKRAGRFFCSFLHATTTDTKVTGSVEALNVSILKRLLYNLRRIIEYGRISIAGSQYIAYFFIHSNIL